MQPSPARQQRSSLWASRPRCAWCRWHFLGWGLEPMFAGLSWAEVPMASPQWMIDDFRTEYLVIHPVEPTPGALITNFLPIHHLLRVPTYVGTLYNLLLYFLLAVFVELPPSFSPLLRPADGGVSGRVARPIGMQRDNFSRRVTRSGPEPWGWGERRAS